MNRLAKVSVILAVIAVIAVGSLAFAGKKPPVDPPPPTNDCDLYPTCYYKLPIACPDVWDPVLCADGVTYSNLCYASVACAPGPCCEVGGLAY